MSVHFRQNGTTIIVFGNTFPIKEKIKALGGRFNGAEKNWRIPMTDEALTQVEGLCATLGGGRLAESSTAPLIVAETVTQTLLVTKTDDADDGRLPGWDQAGPSAKAASEGGMTIRQLMERASAVVTAAFPMPLWVVGEVQNLSRRASGLFLDLAEGAGGGPTGGHQNGTVTARAIVWSGSLAAIRGRRGEDKLAEVLQDGMQIRCLCQVQLYRDRGQITLLVEDIDPAYTKGALALAREKLLKELRAKGLDQANKRLSLPPFPFRIGLVSADGSRAHSDFVDQLKVMAFPGEVLFCPTPMQGEAVPGKVKAAIAALVRADCDLIVITRGGGSAADLRWFDASEIAYAVATCPVPIVAAIGHHDDVVVAEEICFMRQKTPTAAADFVAGIFHATRERIDQMAATVAQLLSRRIDDFSLLQAALGERLAAAGAQAIEMRATRLQQRGHKLHTSAMERLHAFSQKILCGTAPDLSRAADAWLARRREQLALFEKDLAKRDPKPWLEQGWTRLFGPRGQVRGAADVETGETVTVRLIDGKLGLKVESKTGLGTTRKDGT